MKDAATRPGTVYLVGAGPGDPGLLTLRGAQCLARADVVLYDYLANPRLLAQVRAGAETICLGRHGHTKIWKQAEINAELVARAQRGQTVVRLKGGDPLVFGRAGEELAALTAAGIPYEIVPGVTAALAAAAYAGVPLTLRDTSSAVAFVTGHECAGKQEPSLDLAGLVQFPGTLVFYMGVTTSRHWAAELVSAGKPAETPVAIVRRASWPDQETLRCTLGDLAAGFASEAGLRPPVVMIVGAVAATSLPGAATSWFQSKPLFGRRVLVTRAAEQAGELVAALAEQGAEVLAQPAILLGEPDDPGPLEQALARLGDFDWIVFSSANGVEKFCRRLWDSGRDGRALAAAKLAAIGPGTAAALAARHLRADLQPQEFRAESLVEALAPHARGRRFLLIRASRGREVLAEGLVRAGGLVEQVVAYSSRDVAAPDPEIAARLAAGEIGWATVTSSAIARSLVALFGAALHQTRLASISPITSATLRGLGFEPAAEASEYTLGGVVQAILAAEPSAAAE